ncbi:MAG: TIGR02757 family protein [Dysgonomonas sp.]|nr:TIGR02757 family protein [Dysgonomonas sp.]
MSSNRLFDLKEFLDRKVEQYNTPSFIVNDPICVPHGYTVKQDIEIMGFFASIFAWGQRKTIINKSMELGKRMDDKPYEFITGHSETDLKRLLGFKHRTFNDTDLLYCVDFMKRHYKNSDSLEEAFFPEADMSVEEGLNYFRSYFFSHPDAPKRTGKHIPSPLQKSACKRLNMYLRWMVRKDNNGVDFGIWEKPRMTDLICPLDLHVERTARKLGLLYRDKPDWRAAQELTDNLRGLDSEDPVKYDFALFGISIEEKCIID